MSSEDKKTKENEGSFIIYYIIEYEALLHEYSSNSKRNMQILLVMFTIGLSIMIYIIMSFPELSKNDKLVFWKFPRTPEDMVAIIHVIEKYTEKYYYHVLILFVWIYIFLQTFAIPGPLALSIISGALFGKVKGFLLVSVVATSGACCCYLLSSALAKYYVYKYFFNKVTYFKKQVEENKDHIFFYMLFLRITPLLPNWFINLSSPIVGVPIGYYAIATFFGLIPANIFHVYTGSALGTIDKIGFDFKFMLFLLLLGFVALLPIYAKKCCSKYFKLDQSESDKEKELKEAADSLLNKKIN